MFASLHHLIVAIVFAPLVGALGAGLFGKRIGRAGAHSLTIGMMAVSLLLTVLLNYRIFTENLVYNGNLYTWATSSHIQFHVGFLVDRLTALMMMVVTFVSFLVHIYSIGYMQDDSGYQRFFSYISLFTFAMLMLVTANNFFQLFFGWEGVGLVSYLLIGFWFKRDTATSGSMKAFLVNRVGDFGFILGISAVLTYFGTIDYYPVFQQVPEFAAQGTTLSILPGMPWSVITVICLLLFVGAMGKSAQIPLHVWLPESMEGPTPISALIHAATMVTAGVYMVARMSPLFEYSTVALSVVMVIGATGALFLGLVAVVQHDIKRVVAYSTLSQLGYMMTAQGASAFAAGIFHLATHACFKALLFLAAGSVIIGMHHNQDLREMGGLRKRMPITYFCFLIGALSLSAFPLFAGFYSKEAIIEVAHLATIPGAGYAYWCVLLGAFVTPLYIFRAFFLAFHGEPRMGAENYSHVHESPWVVTLPLILLAIPSVGLGAWLAGPLLYQTPGLLGNSITVAPQYNVLAELAHHYHGAVSSALHALTSPSFWLSIFGIFTAWYSCVLQPQLREKASQLCSPLYRLLVNKYGFDQFNDWFFVRGSKRLASWLSDVADATFIDGFLVNGSGRLVTWISSVTRQLQSGYLYHYTFAMLIGLVIFLLWFLLG